MTRRAHVGTVLVLAGASIAILSLWLPYLRPTSSEAWWDYCRHGCSGPERPDLNGLYFTLPALVTVLLGAAALRIGLLARVAPERVKPNGTLGLLAFALLAWGLIQLLIPGFDAIPFARLAGLGIGVGADAVAAAGLVCVALESRRRRPCASAPPPA